MIDFVDNFYYADNYSAIESYDKEKAKQKALKVIMPLIMDNELTEKQSVCLRYKYQNNKSQAEIASLLKLSQPTVSRHISSAKDTLNNSLRYCYIAVSAAIDEYDRLAGEF